MLVHLTKSSWHAKYYKWVKGFYPTYEFKSLCPYFWTLVFYILCSPLILLWKVITSVPIGNYIDTRLKKKYNKPYKEPSKVSKWWDRNADVIVTWVGKIWIGIWIGILLLLIGFGIYRLFVEKGTKMTLIYIFAFIGACTISLLLGYAITTFSDSDAWRIIKGMGYSVKNKVCPMIKWDEPIKNEI